MKMMDLDSPATSTNASAPLDINFAVSVSLLPTDLDEWVRLVERHGDLGCQDRFVNRKCFHAS